MTTHPSLSLSLSAALFLALGLLPGLPVPTGSLAAQASPSVNPAPLPGGSASPRSLEELQRDFVEHRFGMFIHFGILTYTGEWSQANLDISRFNPVNLDCGQWADAAKAAGMSYGVLTTKHHDGFALWPTASSSFSVRGIPWRNGQGDVVREYVDAFRSRGLLPGLYYSVWDNTKKLGNGRTGRKEIDYVKEQLRELLTWYGPIPILVLDGYSWKMGHRLIPWNELRAFVRELQPDCLVIDHTHIQDPWESDLAVFEEPRGVFAPEGNTRPAVQGAKIIDGNDWFWGANSATSRPMDVQTIVEGHLVPLGERYTSFILNCPPDRRGLLDSRIVDILTRVGQVWQPDPGRPPLPGQGPQITEYLTVKSAKAGSGQAGAAIDGKNDSYYYTVWEPDAALPQSITLDLGVETPGVRYLAYVPCYRTVETPVAQGAITRCRLWASSDGQDFRQVADCVWPADASLKTAEFAPVSLRYLKVEVLEANGSPAAATEFGLGR